MKLTEIEKEILTLEVKIRKLYDQYSLMSNNETRTKLWKKEHALFLKQTGLLYGSTGSVKELADRIVYKSGKKRGQLKVNLLK